MDMEHLPANPMYGNEDITNPLVLIDEIESLRDQLKNLKDALCCDEEEKQQLQEQFEDKLNLINALKMEIEDWKSSYEKLLQRNEYLENAANLQDEVQRLLEVNRNLSQEIEDKTRAVGNLMGVIKNKSEEVNRLMNDIEMKGKENSELHKQFHKIHECYDRGVTQLLNEKENALSSLQLARQESQELLHKMKNYDEIVHKKAEISKSFENQAQDYNNLKNILKTTIEENKKLQMDIDSRENNNVILLQEIQRLQEVNNYAVDNINNLQDEKKQYKLSLDLTRKESEILENKLEQFEELREKLHGLTESQEKLIVDKTKLERELHDKTNELDNAMHSIQLTKKESENFLNKLQRELEDLKKVNDELAEEKAELQKDFDYKTEEIDMLHNTLENKIKENKEIVEQIKSLEQHRMATKISLTSLQNENSITQKALDSVRKESMMLMDKLKQYEAQTVEFGKLKQADEQLKLEKERLQAELDRQRADLRRIEQENHELNSLSQNLLTHNEDLERALINLRNELITKSPTPNLHTDVLKEIEDMKKEKLLNHKKIRDLIDKLDELENIISNLSEDVMERDDKIAILENHINALQDEVRKLHQSLAEVVDTGEQINENSHQKIDQSLNKLEAHHSKATHNMKIELAKLHNKSAKLEEQLSANKLKTVESFRDQHKYVSQVIHLQNEREIIVKDIQQLELGSVGDSRLSQDGELEDILNSLDRIRKCLDAKNLKGNTLEQTIVKVQTSSQLLLSKADEAQKILEKEKQKIISEKEEAVTDKLNMEKQLGDLKQRLEKQKNHDKGIIKNLEAEILNQKLIIDKINQSRQDYISKLEEEMRNLQDMYKHSIENVTKLQEKSNELSLENSKNLSIIEKIKHDLKHKSTEIVSLQLNLKELINKPVSDFEVINRNKSTQTDKVVRPDYEKYENNNIVSELIPKQKAKSVNEVQILTANVEPTIDFVKNSYLNYKLQHHSVGRIEHHSISCQDENDEMSEKSGKTFTESTIQNPHLVDIYHRKSMHTDSSKADNIDTEQTITVRGPQSATKSSGFTGFGLTNDMSESNSNENSDKYRDSNVFIASTSDKSADHDLFLIYKDSESSHARQPEIFVETMAMQPLHRKKDVKHVKVKNMNEINQDDFYHEAEEIYYEDDSLKPKLDIELPRVENDSYSMLTLSEGDKKSSVDSYTLAIYSTPKGKDAEGFGKASSKHSNKGKHRHVLDGKNDDSQTEILVKYNNKRAKLNSKKNKDVSKSVGKGSHHKLSRVDANFVLLGERKGAIRVNNENISHKMQEPGTFGLKYILDTVQREVDPGNITNKGLKKCQSDEMINRLRGTNDSSPYELSQFNVSSGGYKSVTEQSIIVKTGAAEDLEDQIKNLTKALQNIEKDYKKKIEAIKMQYDSNIKSMINEHNQGVKSIQSLHEETLQDIIKIHENEVENLRSMSIEAMRKADKLEKENRLLKSKVQSSCTCPVEDLTKISPLDLRKRKMKHRGDTRQLTKTNVEAFNVKPKVRSHGPCTCSLDVNISDTIRNIFEQVDVEQRKLAEHAYLKYIANKIMSSNVEALDAQELSFLHLKVCRTWKTKLSKEEALQKRIDSLETELLNKQRHAQQHIAELDRKVAEERRRLQEVREAVCLSSPHISRGASPGPEHRDVPPPPPPPTVADRELLCNCRSGTYVGERQSAGDLLPGLSSAGLRPRRKTESNRAVMAKLDVAERREKKLYNDEPPTRLRRDRPQARPKK